jgi:hypothetical protein
MEELQKMGPPKNGLKTTEFWNGIFTKIIGLVLILAAFFSDGIKPDLAVWVIGIGAVMLVGVDTAYGLGRSILKSKLPVAVLLLVVLFGLAAINPASAAMTTKPGQTVEKQIQADPDQVNREIVTLLRTMQKRLNALEAQNRALASRDCSLPSKAQPAQILPGKAAQPLGIVPMDNGDRLVASLAARINEQAVKNAFVRGAYGLPGPGQAGIMAGAQMLQPQPYVQAGYSKADIASAVKSAIKEEQTWWDQMPWYARVPLTLGGMFLLTQLGVDFPGL